MKKKFINGLITALALGVISNSSISEIVLADEKEVILGINESDIKGYVNLENYVQLTSGKYEKKVISENEILYIVTIEASKSDNVYIMELGNNKDKIKIGDKYIPCNFEKVGGYVVPDDSEKVIEKDGVLYIPFSFFEGLFNGKTRSVDEKEKLVLPSNLGDYIDEHLEALKGKFEAEKDEEKEEKAKKTEKSNKKPVKHKTPVKKPSKPVVKPPVEEPAKPPTIEPEKPPVEEPAKPPTTEPEKPPVEEPGKQPTTEPEKPPVEEPVEPPVIEPEKPPVEDPAKPPVTEPEKPPVEEPAKPPVIEPENPLEENKDQLSQELV